MLFKENQKFNLVSVQTDKPPPKTYKPPKSDKPPKTTSGSYLYQ